MSDRPKGYRKAIPDRLKLSIYIRHNGRDAHTGERLGHYLSEVEYDHDPALELRPWSAEAGDTVPPQLDPAFIFPLTKNSHKRKTHGPQEAEKRHLMQRQGDRAAIRKTKDRRASHQEHLERVAKKGTGESPPKPKRSSRWPKRPFPGKAKR